MEVDREKQFLGHLEDFTLHHTISAAVCML